MQVRVQIDFIKGTVHAYLILFMQVRVQINFIKGTVHAYLISVYQKN